MKRMNCVLVKCETDARPFVDVSTEQSDCLLALGITIKMLHTVPMTHSSGAVNINAHISSRVRT